jgi:curved DNA-binding protein CbpA
VLSVATRSSSDPYTTLGVSPGASDAELRAAYRRLVQLHHPDHNGGSPESALRFEEVQEAYAQVLRLRRRGDAAGAPRPGAARSTGTRAGAARASSARPGATTPPRPTDPDLESRLADMERELQTARAARERAQREAREAARQAAQAAGRPRASDEDLGYVTTDDSLSKILADAAAGLSERVGELSEHLADARLEHLAGAARERPVTKRVADLIDELGSRLTGEHHKH